VSSEASDALRIILMWLLHSELREFINEADRAEKLSRREAERLTLEFRDTQRAVELSLEALRHRIGPQDKPYFDQLSVGVERLADQCEALVGKTNKIVSESMEEREKFVHLAGIGLITEFIFHELDRAVDHTMRVLSDVRGSRRDSALRSLEEQLVTLQKRISAFDELTGERRQVKSTFDLGEVVRLVLDSRAKQFERHGILVSFDRPKAGLKIKAVRGMVLQILENLIASSVYWLRQQKHFEPEFKPQIWVTIDSANQILSLEDNGPGIDPRRRDAIFQPFVTSKPPGEGRGLGLYISRNSLSTTDGNSSWISKLDGSGQGG
jgi:signal transduction histidine kinase